MDETYTVAQYAAIGLVLVLALAPLLALARGLMHLRRYRREVLRLMNTGASAPPAPLPTTADIAPLEVDFIDARSALPERSSALVAAARGLRHRVNLALLAAGLTAIAAMIGGMAIAAYDPADTTDAEDLTLALLLCYPLLLSWATLTSPARWLRATALIGVVVLAVVVEQAFEGYDPGSMVLVFAYPALVQLLIVDRRTRGSVPILLLASVPMLIGLVALFAALAAIPATWSEGPQAEQWATITWLVVVGGCIALAFVPRAVAGRLATQYAAKRYSDQMLLWDTCWMFFIVSFALLMIAAEPDFLLGGLVCLLAIPAYQLAQRHALRLAGRRLPSAAPRLLFLRVFGFAARSESFVEALAYRWRFLGPIQLVAAPDVATANMDPPEFFALYRKRVDTLFVQRPEDVESRVDGADYVRDPDARFRINEFFCFNTVWQPVVQRLLASTDTVLMDLRGFSRERRGCRYELGQIVALAPIERCVFIADRHTDTELLRSELAAAWAQMPAGSPNAGPGPRHARVLRIERHDRRELAALIEMLAATGASSAPDAESAPAPAPFTAVGSRPA